MAKNSFIILLVVFVAATVAALEREPLNTPEGTSVERFTLGGTVQGAIPIYHYQDTVTADIDQKEIIVNIQYPNPQTADQSADSANAVVTSVSLYLVGTQDFTSQAFTTSGGIGERSITLQVVASNTETLRYVVIIEGLLD
ncbi:uncharacterized protein LOC101460255 [Ceratitis capitata]|uniref:Uncharacterized protein n=1 Tax=Ceratitis capitata TaxID=7213 RepID=W8C7Z3_CERCA|nr:uncharacterized protein LOC101460255 [Ceratitis capitata]